MLDPLEYGLIPTKNTDKNIATVMKRPTKHISMETDSQTTNILWGECHKKTKSHM